MVLKKWEECSRELFDDKNDPTFDNNFLEQKLAELKITENSPMPTQPHPLNESINDEEIDKVVDTSKTAREWDRTYYHTSA